MRRAPFRQVYVLMLGLLVVLGMSFFVVQASNMAAGMTMAGQHMSGTGMGDCGSCKDGPGGAKIMVCDAACAAPVNATVPQFTALQIQRAVEQPLSQSPILSGWTASPNPHPPKHIALI
jgi:hypothetical protein